MKLDMGMEEEEEEEDEEEDEERQQNWVGAMMVRSMKRQIAELEQTLIQPRSWELQGETTATTREENGLLEVDLDVDRIGVSAPVSTVESTLSLEDMIKVKLMKLLYVQKRILDQAFDDPIRKQAPREEVKKEVEEVSTEKSAKGLAEIYEDEYMLQMHNLDKKKDELDKKKVSMTSCAETQLELKDMFTRISVALDRLCNTNFTPSAAVATLSVVSSAPALAMEEALPISVSSETQKAPEEVRMVNGVDGQLYSKTTKVLKGESEKDQEERERERKVCCKEPKVMHRQRRQESTLRRYRKRMNLLREPNMMKRLVRFLKIVRFKNLLKQELKQWVRNRRRMLRRVKKSPRVMTLSLQLSSENYRYA